MIQILIVGSGFSGLTTRLLNAGYEYIILKDRTTCKHPEKKYKRMVLCDFSTKETVLKAINSLTEKPGAVMTLYEKYVLPTSWIAEHLGLPGMSSKAAEACTDKWIMRQTMAEAPKPINPGFAIVRNENDLLKFAKKHQFPLMLKPANLVKSLLITKNDTLEELLENYQHTTSIIESVYEKYAQNRKPTIIVEEFLTGSMHTVAGFADKNGEPHIADPIVDLQLAREIGFKDNFLYNRILPSQLSAKDQEALRETARVGMRALGMKSSPAHVEIILTPDGPRIVEIGARNGGYRERMYDMACGIDLVAAAIDVALGNKPKLNSTKNNFCAVLELFPRKPGIFAGVKNFEKVEKLASCVYCSIKSEPGSFAGKASDGFKRCAIIILNNADKSQFEADLDFVNQNVNVITKEPSTQNKETTS